MSTPDYKQPPYQALCDTGPEKCSKPKDAIQLQQAAFRKDKDNLDFLEAAGVGLETFDPAGEGVSWRVEGTTEWYDSPRSAIAAARFPKTPGAEASKQAPPIAKPDVPEGICALYGGK